MSKKTEVEVATEISTAQKISVGLVVGTATLVLISAIIAGIYTLTKNAAGVGVRGVSQPTASSPSSVPVVKDRVLTTPAQ